MKKIFVLLLTITSITNLLFAQNPEKTRLLTGPVVGSVTKNSAKIWIAYKGNGQNMVTIIDTVDKKVYYPTSLQRTNDNKGNATLIMTFTGLEPEHVYKPVYSGSPLFTIHPKCNFQTLADSAVKDIEFLIGSCALLNTDFSRFMFPGPSANIFLTMKRQRSDFMLWLGDNIYYLNRQYANYQNMFTRNLKVREGFIGLREFLAAQPNYAIWDDHDFGWNDSDRKFPLKDSSLAIFKGFWPNPYPDTLPFKGNYFTFRYYDAEFFMTDDRYYRDPEGDTAGAFLGNEQLQWLKHKLSKSNATFKFVCIGSQVLNDAYYGESYAKYPKERNELLDFIAHKNIKGVIFITGDKHYSELSKRDWKGYPFYDFTSSPLTSPVVPMRYLKGAHNNYNIPGTDLYKRNFGKIYLTGPADNRTCKMVIYGKGGQKKWDYTVNANDLQKTDEPKTKPLKGK